MAPAGTVRRTGQLLAAPDATPASPFKRFNSSPEVIRLAVPMYVRFPLSLRNVEGLLFERDNHMLKDAALQVSVFSWPGADRAAGSLSCMQSLTLLTALRVKPLFSPADLM